MADGSANASLEKRGGFSLKGCRQLRTGGGSRSGRYGPSLGSCRHHHPLTQFLPGLEGGNPFRRYRDRLTGFRITGPAGRTVIQAETAESADFNAVTVNQCCVDGTKNLCHRHFSIPLYELWETFSEQGDEFGAGHDEILPEVALRQAACFGMQVFPQGVEVLGSRASMNRRNVPTFMEERHMAHPNIVVQSSGATAAPTLLGQGPARIPTGGKIRAGIKVLTKKAAADPKAKAIYEQGVAAGQSFEQIERTIAEALPNLKTPLVPWNVPWFTVRAYDFPNPETAREILHAYGEDRGEGRHLYRFPVVFPSDYWQIVMPHELAAWGTHDKHYWSQYSADGRVRHCMCHAPVPVDDTGLRTIRLFGGRKTMVREDNDGLCEPESCREYQQRQCNLTGHFLFFIPGVRSISAFELHTNSYYAMNAAIQKFETVSFLRGGRISGFLDRQRTPFYLTKKLMEVAHIDEQGRAVRVPQWIIDLEAPVDVTALLRENDDTETALAQAQLATRVLQGGPVATNAASLRQEAADMQAKTGADATSAKGPPLRDGRPSLEQLMIRVQAYGIVPERFQAYADWRWGRGWKINPNGRAGAWDELERYRNDPQSYLDKIESEMQLVSRGRTA